MLIPMYTRLARESPWKAQIGCSAVLALIVASPGLFIGYMTWTRDHSDNRTAILWFSGVFVAVGVLLLLSAIHQAFAVRSPETMIEIDPGELTAGSVMRIRVIQPGPIRLRSIHANLAGEETTWVSSSSNRKSSRSIKYLGPYRMFEMGHEEIADGETLEREASFDIPDIPATDESGEKKTRWKIEVWGRVAWWPDFMHPFPVQVRLSDESRPLPDANRADASPAVDG